MLTGPKRKGSPYWQITGTYCGVRVRESTQTDDRRIAEKIRVEREHEIQHAKGSEKQRTVSHAIVEYIENGGENKYLHLINEHLGQVPLDEVNQHSIDRAAREAYAAYRKGDNGKLRTYSKSTIKRQFYTPLASVLHYAHDIGWMPYLRIKMPKVDRPPPQWADKKWFEKFFKNASKELAAITTFLAGTGCRISETLNLKPNDVNLDEGWAYVRTTKNGEPRMVYLSEIVMNAIRPYVEADEKAVFYMYNSRHNVNNDLKRTCDKAKIEYLSTHKVGSHTFATNLALYANMDAKALTETGRWKDPKSTHHYTHYVTRDQAKKADALTQMLTQN
ncbi:MAG: tyrosine-type recombinase/integrase [Candidatus Thiodiazotropha endolucinida]|nr:tyrosine-type recombinase/integrase [Candidatus Thiodiazotropha taylori]MCG8047767.1 tyrosine-type recombinase/integrase [Candidatus Thiodiazotropha taylori]MCW4323542.1 tyrosine-type recombinase/integrase [Candidatus Thiodiazotropha taylori]MCW4345509.1 tyrosine-type recombinase/integrase [Candidatus Thiodiazotropha endolucinida]